MKKIEITKIVNKGNFFHIEGYIENKKHVLVFFIDEIDKLHKAEKLLVNEVRKNRPELFI